MFMGAEEKETEQEGTWDGWQAGGAFVGSLLNTTGFGGAPSGDADNKSDSDLMPWLIGGGIAAVGLIGFLVLSK